MFTAHNLTLGYHGRKLVERLSFTVEPGQITAVIGHNGAGKSTLIRTMLGLQPPLDGHFDWARGKPSQIGYIGQTNELDHQFPIRVKDVVAMGVWKGLGFWSGIDAAKSERILNALDRTGLTDISDQPLYECSSGQLQRCFFARAIAQDAPLLLLDEPFSAIDQTTESRLIDIIRDWRDEGRSILIILHDLSAVMNVTDHCLLLGNGSALFGATKSVITIQNLVSFGYMTESQAQFLSLPHYGGRNA